MSKLPLPFAAFGALLALAGCGGGGGGPTEQLADSVASGTAPYAVLDLSSRQLTWLRELPGGASAPALRQQSMAFRRVTVGGGEALVGIFEVTQAQWMAIAAPAPAPWTLVPDAVCDSAFAVAPERPAYNLDHETVAAELAAFALTDGRSLRLPTLAEWHAACGVSSGWTWGDTATREQLIANAAVREGLNAVDASRLDANGADRRGPLAVGSRAANALGFYDLHGNVWELIQGGTARGGSWFDGSWQSRAEQSLATTELFHEELDYALVGIRLVLVP